MINNEHLVEYLSNHENGVEISIKAVDKLIRNKNEETKVDGEQATLCSSTCSKRGIYEIYASLGLIKLVKYDVDENSKYFQIVDEDSLKNLKEQIIENYK